MLPQSARQLQLIALHGARIGYRLTSLPSLPLHIVVMNAWVQMAPHYPTIETEGLDLTGMAPEDLAALRGAVRSLEHPGLAARLTNMVGKPVELIGNVLPASATQGVRP